MLVSDASVQKNKQSGFAWTITHKNTPLWKGMGLAPGTAKDIYSGHAKAFGLVVGLTFLHYYISCYGHHTFQEADLQCFCNNIGVITNVMAFLHPTTIWPNNTTNDDRNIYLEISALTNKCTPLLPQFQHVQGHQDQKANCPLTIWEQYNIDCDDRAKWYTCTVMQSSTKLGNPAIPTAQPHLQIGRKIICHNLMTAL